MLEQLLAQEGPKGLAMLGVSASAQGIDHQVPESMQDLKTYAEQFHVTYPLLFDASLDQAKTYGVKTYPTLYLLDKAGKVAWGATGEVPLDTLKVEVEKVL